MRPQTFIIGGGFAGLRAVKGLARANTDVTLIDPSPATTMLPALPDVAGGWVPERLARRSLGELLPSHVRHVQQSVSCIDLDAHAVVAGGEPLDYDHLLIAAGSAPDFQGAPFPRDRMHPLATLDDARRIRLDFNAYLQETAHPQVLVAGTGYTGLELAMSLHFRAEASGKPCGVLLVDPSPILLPSLPEKRRQYVLDFLTERGVDVRLGVAVESFDGRDAVAGGKTLAHVFFCWAAGSAFAVPKVIGNVERLRDGRLKVSPDLSLPNYPDVFAAGDSAAVIRHGQPLRKAVNFAFHGGLHAGRNLARRLRGKPTRPFRPADLGWVVPFRETSLGRLPFGLWVRGRLGVRLHHLMCGVRNYSFGNFAGFLKLALDPSKGEST